MHNDLKPDNICLGNFGSQKLENLHKFYLIDFGLSEKYRYSETTTGVLIHRKSETSGFKGNLAYASANALQKKTTSRRDDVQSLFFLLYHLLTGRVFGEPETPTKLPLFNQEIISTNFL